MAAKPFVQTLAAIRFGALHDELSEKMNTLTQACADTGRKGSITLTITMKPGRAGQVEITDEVKMKVPELERGTTLMFVTQEGNLQRDDPRQLALEGLREVPQAPLREPKEQTA